ncbi:hypothetical protein B0A52_10070 [Exophiala mesophila]|uniref:Guanine nucleotide-exchange factor SEC12 n=1 Tax=Exophiala mesophila TaxID=212818 RepID=A0A438MT66_EXOME|nr:hypothetical protein B0A52_10070 [Exophiala mesophila]
MAPVLPCAQIKLSYPLAAADFDPLNKDFLLVGGGGGSSSTGVPNKISLIDSARRETLRELVDIELAKDEDSVTTLAIAETGEGATGEKLQSHLTVYAGINSSAASQAAGKNEHLRSFRIQLPQRRSKDDLGAVDKPQGGISRTEATKALSRAAVFRAATGSKNETYQRVLRVNRNNSNSPLAAIASGLAPENEVIVFRASSTPTSKDEISRINLGKREAADLDLHSSPASSSSDSKLAYCTDDEVFIQSLQVKGSKKPDAPVSLYRTPESTMTLPSNKRPKFRAIRFLDAKTLLLLQNLPDRGGAVLLVLKISEDNRQSQIRLRKRLNKTTKVAVGLEVARLSATDQSDTQHVIAVSGQNSSIEILVLDFLDSSYRSFKPYTHLENVHSGPLTRIAFSNFLPPPTPDTKSNPPSQHLRLASVGVDQYVRVHYMPLRPYVSRSSKAPRYVLIPPSSNMSQTTIGMIYALVIVAIAAFLMQAFTEIRGATPPVLGATNWLPPRMQDWIARPYLGAETLKQVPAQMAHQAENAADIAKQQISNIPDIDDITHAVEHTSSMLKRQLSDLVAENTNLETPKAIILRDEGVGEISTETIQHDVDLVKEETVKRWDELSQAQQRTWKLKLKEAGHWAEHQGESVFKGLLFSVLRDVIHG